MQQVFKQKTLRQIAGLMAMWIFVLSAGFSMHYLCNCMSLQDHEVSHVVENDVKSCCSDYSENDQCCDDSFLVKMHIDAPIGNANIYQEVEQNQLDLGFTFDYRSWGKVDLGLAQSSFIVGAAPYLSSDFQVLYQRFLC